jgi:quercetin dioxygenase-like cupin family protein
MNRTLLRLLAAASLVVVAALPLESLAAEPTKGPQLENLLKTKLARVADTEVIVSRVTIPPNAELPRHWHPGEEFAYIIEGEVTLWLKDKKDIVGKAGDAVQVPLKQVHSAKAGPKGAVVLVFRVHETGKPERVMVK